jgi:hypothetical protein
MITKAQYRRQIKLTDTTHKLFIRNLKDRITMHIDKNWMALHTVAGGNMVSDYQTWSKTLEAGLPDIIEPLRKELEEIDKEAKKIASDFNIHCSGAIEEHGDFNV